MSTKSMQLMCAPRNQTGRSLIEIMIALTVGLIMVTAMMGAFVANQQTNTQSNAKTKLINEGNIAMSTLGRIIRQAGYGEIASATRMGDASKDLSLAPVHGCDGGYAATGSNKVADLSSTSCKSSPAASSSDSITLSMQVEPVNCTNGTVAGITAFEDNSNWGGDVLGQCVQAVINARGVPISQVSQRFEIVMPSTGSDLPPAIYARTSRVNSLTTPLIDNIEQMRLRYLVSSTSSGEGDTYMTATQVNTTNKFRDVVGVSVCLLMSTDVKSTAQQASSATYLDCDGSSRASTDAKLRMTFQNTFIMRNRATAISHNF
jgi:type IV pilus assembly protein PilW